MPLVFTAAFLCVTLEELAYRLVTCLCIWLAAVLAESLLSSQCMTINTLISGDYVATNTAISLKLKIKR